MGITLKQIAEMAGVHKSTVDKVIHNRPGVSEAKRQQIRQLLEEYGYESNPLAKALNYQKKKLTVAVVLPIVDALPELKSGVDIVRQDFNSFNIEILFCETPFSDAAAQAKCLRELCAQRVAGVVLDPIENPVIADAMRELHEAHIPVVTVNSDLAESPRLCFVGQDMEQSGRIAARLMGLLTGEAGEIGIVSSRSLSVVVRRKNAFEQYLADCWPALQIVGEADIRETPEDAYQKTAALLERYPSLSGLFITCGCVADVCQAVRDAGRIGEISILCYEQYPAIVELVRAGEIACTIGGDLKGQGRLAMRLLFEHIIYDSTPEQPEVYTKNVILLRENI